MRIILFARGWSVRMRMIQMLQKVYYGPLCMRPAHQHNTDQVHFLYKKIYCPLCEKPACHYERFICKQKLFDLSIGTGWPIRMIWIIRQRIIVPAVVLPPVQDIVLFANNSAI